MSLVSLVAQFRQSLPSLQSQYEGKWVIFRESGIVGAFSTFKEAYEEAYRRFDNDSSYIVEQIAPPQEPTPITAGVLFGLC